MTKISLEMAASEDVLLTVLTHLKNGKIDDTIAHFACVRPRITSSGSQSE